MPQAARFVAFDLGAESGRCVVGLFDGHQLQFASLHRFPNWPVRILDGLHWDVLRLFDEMKRALRMYAAGYGTSLDGIGIDTWGVDFALLGGDDVLLGNPYHYRDRRTQGMIGEALRRLSRKEIFEQTGIQFMEINTLYQLLAMAIHQSPALEVAGRFLMIPDLLNFWLTGQKVCEFTNATTTQFYDPRRCKWATPILQKLGLPIHILPDVIAPGTVMGPVLSSVAEEVGLLDVPVIAPACHDTGSAVAAVPAKGRDYAYISSGTWSLMGTEVREPIITDQSLAYNFTNEGGVCGTFRFLKNIMGLWLVQECRRTWAGAGDALAYQALIDMAARARPFGPLIEPDHHSFLRPGDMPNRIRAFCQKTRQPIPEDEGAVIRCVLESLALKYRWVLERLEEMLECHLEVVHIVGGGAQNQLLCQFTASTTWRPVIAGPVQATAIGNLLLQMLALGHVASLEEARDLVRRSFGVVTYEPQHRDGWEEAYSRFLRVMEQAVAL